MNWYELLVGKEGISFLLEIAFRTFIMFILVLILLRLTGKRSIKQLSIFEIVMIIALGSAAGDPMIYKERALNNMSNSFFGIFLSSFLYFRVIFFCFIEY